MPKPGRSLPELFHALEGYTRHQFVKDAVAGMIVGVIALPLAIAFAIASGLPRSCSCAGCLR